MSRRCKHCHLNQSIMDAEITGTASPLGLILFVVACCALFLYIYVSLFHQEKEVTSEGEVYLITKNNLKFLDTVLSAYEVTV